MRTRKTLEITYHVIERDISGLIPDWAAEVNYRPDIWVNQIRFVPQEHKFEKEQEEIRQAEEAYKRLVGERYKHYTKHHPELTPDEVQKIVRHLEDCLVDNG
jgi:hypothetical protein